MKMDIFNNRTKYGQRTINKDNMLLMEQFEILRCFLCSFILIAFAEGKAVSRNECLLQTACQTCADVNLDAPILDISKTLLNINGDMPALRDYFPDETESRRTLSAMRKVLRVS